MKFYRETKIGVHLRVGLEKELVQKMVDSHEKWKGTTLTDEDIIRISDKLQDFLRECSRLGFSDILDMYMKNKAGKVDDDVAPGMMVMQAPDR
jgi:phosphosulfolactate synthase (CoM biosynthesis protein A)